MYWKNGFSHISPISLPNSVSEPHKVAGERICKRGRRIWIGDGLESFVGENIGGRIDERAVWGGGSDCASIDVWKAIARFPL